MSDYILILILLASDGTPSISTERVSLMGECVIIGDNFVRRHKTAEYTCEPVRRLESGE